MTVWILPNSTLCTLTPIRAAKDWSLHNLKFHKIHYVFWENKKVLICKMFWFVFSSQSWLHILMSLRAEKWWIDVHLKSLDVCNVFVIKDHLSQHLAKRDGLCFDHIISCERSDNELTSTVSWNVLTSAIITHHNDKFKQTQWENDGRTKCSCCEDTYKRNVTRRWVRVPTGNIIYTGMCTHIYY